MCVFVIVVVVVVVVTANVETSLGEHIRIDNKQVGEMKKKNKNKMYRESERTKKKDEQVD